MSTRTVEPTATASSTPARSWRRTLAAYVSLTKPQVMELLLVTTAPAMILAARGLPNLWLVLGVLIAGAMSAGGASAFNCYLDRDIDRLMHRTEDRPLATGEISPRSGLVFAITLCVASTVMFLLIANPLTAVLNIGAIFFYVVVYTLWLKRRTSQNIIWGGAAGCFPTLIGWASVTNSLDWAPFVLFMIVFLWTPPHYWPLSIKYRDDYETAGVPMLGVIAGHATVGLQTVLYAWATVVCSLLLIPIGGMGVIYAVVAVASGGWFVYETHRLYYTAVAGLRSKPMRVFTASITYLTLLFAAVAIDPLLHFAI